jgi:hypothetical protein
MERLLKKRLMPESNELAHWRTRAEAAEARVEVLHAVMRRAQAVLRRREDPRATRSEALESFVEMKTTIEAAEKFFK